MRNCETSSNPLMSGAAPIDVMRTLRMVLSAVLVVLVGSGAFPAAVSAQDQQMITENSSMTLTLSPNGDGLPTAVVANIVASADLEQFVIDAYVDGILVSSEREPDALSLEFEPTREDRVVRIDVREFGETTACEVGTGSVQLQDIEIERVPDSEEISLLDHDAWTVGAPTAAEVANLAAVGTFGSTEDFRISEDAPVAVQVGPEETFTSAEELWDDLSGEPRVLPRAGERFVIAKTSELSSNGGSVFISESEFGGRVGSVALTGTVFLAPQAATESGFTVRVNDTIVDSGLIDADGQASFDVVIDGMDWPRDATLSLDLSLVETETPCNDERPFSGQVEFSVVPVGTPAGALTVSDFPAVLLEGDAGLFVGPDASDQDVAVVSSALQAAAAERIVFLDADRDAAAVVIQRGAAASVLVEGDQLVVTLTDELVELLQEERFWIFNDEATGDVGAVEVIPESLAFTDLDESPLGDLTSESSLLRIVPFALLVLLVIAVLSLLWKNSKAPAES